MQIPTKHRNYLLRKQRKLRFINQGLLAPVNATTLRDSTKRVHTISICQTKTGGAGINLQAANVVFLLDQVWSPALEWQARSYLENWFPHDVVYIYNFRLTTLLMTNL